MRLERNWANQSDARAAWQPANFIGDGADRLRPAPADVGVRNAAGMRHVIEVLDEENRLLVRNEDDTRLLMSEKSGEVMDLRLALPRVGRRSVHDERIDVLRLAKARNRRITPRILGG